MDKEHIYTLISSIGDDAKTILITYLLLEYGTTLVVFGLVTWGVRTVWKNRESLNL